MPAFSDPFKLIGTTLDGKYRVDRVLGEGGFGVVYGGFHMLVGQPIAIKCLKPSTGLAEQQQRMTELFLREARVLFSLTHPGIVRLYDMGTIPVGSSLTAGSGAPCPYVVLEYIHGRSLEQEIEARRQRGGPHFAAGELRAIFDQVLDALAFAHERGVIHRDIKPSNVMLSAEGDKTSARLVDFGIARVAESGGMTTTGGAFTPKYAAPEQWDPSIGAIGPATDIWAMALTLAEAAMLAPMLPGNAVSELVLAVMDPRRRASLGRSRPDLPPGVDAVVLRATAVRPQERFSSAREMREALQSALAPFPQAISAASLAAVSSGPTALAPSQPYSGQPPQPAQPSHYAQPQGYGPQLGYTPQPMFVPQYAPPQPRSRSPLLALTAVMSALALIAVVGIGVFLVVQSSSKPSKSSHSPPAVAPTQPAAAAPPLPTNLPRPKGYVLLTGNMGGDPFWTLSEIDAAVRPRLGELDLCWEQNIDRKNKKEYVIDTIVSAEPDGRVSDVMCSMRGGNEPPEIASLCTCIQGKAGAWRLPRAHGKLGLLESGDVILTFTFRYR